MAPAALLLLGPTASGKTALAMALADRLPVEIVSVDSAQVYRGMDVGTAKPDAATLARYPHHLVDIAEPTEAYSAARFRDDALAAMAAIHARGRVPLLAGGTMLYARALTQGLSDLPPADAAVRAGLEARAREIGIAGLYAELARVDPVTAARLAPADSQRIQRALEVHALTGRPLSALQDGAAGAPPFPYRLLTLGLFVDDRAVLHARIAARFEAMLKAGLVEELDTLRARHPALTRELPSMRAVGYRQAWAYRDGEIGLDDLRAQGIAATRQLAKRQLTWLRGTPGVAALDALDPGVAARASARCEAFLAG